MRMHRGKGYQSVAAQVERGRLYEPEEALSKVKELARARFDETVEAAVRLGVDPRHADQMVRGAVVLPHGTGRQVRVAVFARGEAAKAAQAAGAEVVGDEDLVQRIREGWLEFDVAIATPEMMGLVGQLGRILGPRGLMPNPKSGTVTPDPARAVQEAKAGRVEYRTDRAGIVHAPIGKVSFPVEALAENLRTLVDALVKARPETAKGQYLRSVTVSSTMGPGIRVNPARVA
ncbi:MAG: 50S ribosomal protein L1 [Firmicutes bacterium]|nr:50S ribosomal protein L1 [Bacillota bacterium]